MNPDEIECWAFDYQGNIRGKHKAHPAMYDGKATISCVWCGYFLDTPKLVDIQPELCDTKNVPIREGEI